MPYYPVVPWRVVLSDGSTVPTGAATGDYVQSVAAGATISSGISGFLNAAFTNDFGSTFRVRSAFFCAAGAADPTSTITISVYAVTVNAVAAGAGISYTLGAQVANSVITQTAPVRGTIYNLTSAEFTLTTGGVYQFVVSISGAAMPALVVLRTFHILENKGT